MAVLAGGALSVFMTFQIFGYLPDSQKSMHRYTDDGVVRVIGEEFVGATATVYLETPQGQEIRVQKGHDELAGLPLDIGRELFANWSPADSHLVAEA